MGNIFSCFCSSGESYLFDMISNKFGFNDSNWTILYYLLWLIVGIGLEKYEISFNWPYNMTNLGVFAGERKHFLYQFILLSTTSLSPQMCHVQSHLQHEFPQITCPTNDWHNFAKPPAYKYKFLFALSSRLTERKMYEHNLL